MVGILGSPYLDLEPHLDLSLLETISEEIIRGVCKLRRCDLASNVGTVVPQDGMTVQESILYESFKRPIIHGGFLIPLRNIIDGDYFKAEDSEDSAHFPILMSWIRTLPFKLLARAVIFYHVPGLPTFLHRDGGPSVLEKNHMYFNPMLKPFFVMEGETKVFVKTRSAMINIAEDFHGSDPSNISTFSFRIDGVFTDDFAERIGIRSNPLVDFLKNRHKLG